MNHDGALAGERFADILLDLLPGRLVAEPGPNKSKQIDELLLRQGACKSRHGRAAHTFRGRQSPENDIEDIARIGAARASAQGKIDTAERNPCMSFMAARTCGLVNLFSIAGILTGAALTHCLTFQRWGNADTINSRLPRSSACSLD